MPYFYMCIPSFAMYVFYEIGFVTNDEINKLLLLIVVIVVVIMKTIYELRDFEEVNYTDSLYRTHVYEANTCDCF